MANSRRWWFLLVSSLLLSMAFLQYPFLSSASRSNPGLQDVNMEMVNAHNKSMISSPKKKVIEGGEKEGKQSEMEVSAREVPTGPNPIHHHKAPSTHH